MMQFKPEGQNRAVDRESLEAAGGKTTPAADWRSR